jgi:hypothetical protein
MPFTIAQRHVNASVFAIAQLNRNERAFAVSAAPRHQSLMRAARHRIQVVRMASTASGPTNATAKPLANALAYSGEGASPGTCAPRPRRVSLLGHAVPHFALADRVERLQNALLDLFGERLKFISSNGDVPASVIFPTPSGDND